VRPWMVGAAIRERELPWMALLRVSLGMHEHLAGPTRDHTGPTQANTEQPQNERAAAESGTEWSDCLL
jgi:hypothetical protein